jgi:hypothetical protein
VLTPELARLLLGDVMSQLVLVTGYSGTLEKTHDALEMDAVRRARGQKLEVVASLARRDEAAEPSSNRECAFAFGWNRQPGAAPWNSSRRLDLVTTCERCQVRFTYPELSDHDCVAHLKWVVAVSQV